MMMILSGSRGIARIISRGEGIQLRGANCSPLDPLPNIHVWAFKSLSRFSILKEGAVRPTLGYA